MIDSKYPQRNGISHRKDGDVAVAGVYHAPQQPHPSVISPCSKASVCCQSPNDLEES